MARIATAAVVLSLLLAAAAGSASANVNAGNWDLHQQAFAVHVGLAFPLSDGRYHGEQALTRAQMRPIRDALAKWVKLPPVPVRSGNGKVTVAEFHAMIARQLGFTDDAQRVQAETARVGLNPPARFGTEVVVRMIEITHAQHLPQNPSLVLYPWDPVTRSEVAWTMFQIATLPPKELAFTHDVLAVYSLPRYTPAQRRVLRRAVARIGMPFIEAGISDHPTASQPRAGYDCSGFLHVVWQGSGLAAARKMRSRTAAGMAGEIPFSQRIRREDIQPADLMFFGMRGASEATFRMAATPHNIHHSAIALSRDFGIAATYQGVDVQPMWDQWFYDDFAWGRRLL